MKRKKIFIKLEFGNIKGKWKLPQSYRDVSIKQGLEIENLTDKREILSVLTKCPIEYLNIIQDKQIESIYNSLDYLKSFIPEPVKDSVRVGFRRFKRRSLLDMTVDEYLDLDILSKNKNITRLLALIYQNKNVSRDKTEKILSEKLNYYDSQNIAMLIKCETEKLCEMFPILFPADNGPIPLFEDEYTTEEEKASMRERDNNSFQSKWGVFYLLQVVSDGMLTEQIAWRKRSIKELFQELTYRIDKYNYENQK